MFEGQAVASSRKVAERFDRSHKEILEAIQKIVCDGPSLERHFVENAYMNSLNRSKTEFLMDRKGFFLVVGNFVGKAAFLAKLDYIQAFNEMQERLAKPIESSLH